MDQAATDPQLMDSELNRMIQQATYVKNDKQERCYKYKLSPNVFPTYKENSPKEELVLEHVIQFKRQFQLHYDERRELYLYPKNECDVYKFICTTVRPQKVGYLELYNYDQCSKYLSYFLDYEQLDPPDQFPTVIPSPSNVALWQKGDCFDFSILLSSLLIGVGYDAYCVYGIAPREITSKNEADLDYLYINKGVTEEEVETEQQKEEHQVDEYTIKKKEEELLSYDAKLKIANEIIEKQQRITAMTINDDEPDEMGPDEYSGRRIHCWVLIKAGKRGVKQHIFIEPTTGRMYPINESPYLKVDAAFNNRNFWVNMKLESKVADVNFDEMDTSMNWEYVMLDTMGEQAQQEEEEYQYGGDEANIQQRQIDPELQQLQDIAQLLDIPPPWAPKIQIDKEAFLKGMRLGESTVFFKKVKVDSYAPYSQPDGLVQKLTIYQDYKRLKVLELRYFYHHRSDKLIIKRRLPFEFKTIMEYEPADKEYEQGKKCHIKQILMVDRRLRIITYYASRHHDGLMKRTEIIGEKTVEQYQNRDDRVVYRSVRFNPTQKKFEQRDITFIDKYLGQVKIEKMTQKFEKNEYAPANDQISKMIVDLKKNKVFVYYHMNEGEINPRVKEYPRENMHGFAKLTEAGGEKKIDDPLVQQENQKISALEKECHSQIKNQEEAIISEERSLSSKPLELEKTLHDKARERSKETSEKSKEEVSRQKAEQDYLVPYLEKMKIEIRDHYSREEAASVKNYVMSKLKERLLQRAAIIQKKLEEERQKLEEAEMAIQKKAEIDKNQENDIEAINFRIDILEQRASRFESQALQKYQEMDEKLNKDNRFSGLQK